MTEVISIFLIVICLTFSVIILWKKFKVKNKENTHRYELVEAKEEKSITAEYLLSYILPLFAFDFTQWDEVVLFLVFFLTLGFLCVKHHHFSTNLALEIINYKFYVCTLNDDNDSKIEKIVVSKESLSIKTGDEVILKHINNEFMLHASSLK